VQQPHPPIWMGISSVESAVFAAKAGYNIVALMPAAAMKSRVAAYRDAQTSDAGKLGISYLIVVGEDDATAMRDASQADTRWHTSFHHLYTLHGRAPMLGAWPSKFSGLMDQQRAIAGSPQTVADFLCEQVETSGINYVVSQLMFGDLPHESAVWSIRLFAEEVIPRVKRVATKQITTKRPQ
jgi:alkanesulfonate monooxygenase SsuD/methylene tetrahydromethanopterin reductase-like flavin-dependent oxidoreductase (luciferase family)